MKAILNAMARERSERIHQQSIRERRYIPNDVGAAGTLIVVINGEEVRFPVGFWRGQIRHASDVQQLIKFNLLRRRSPFVASATCRRRGLRDASDRHGCVVLVMMFRCLQSFPVMRIVFSVSFASSPSVSPESFGWPQAACAWRRACARACRSARSLRAAASRLIFAGLKWTNRLDESHRCLVEELFLSSRHCDFDAPRVVRRGS